MKGFKNIPLNFVGPPGRSTMVALPLIFNGEYGPLHLSFYGRYTKTGAAHILVFCEYP